MAETKIINISLFDALRFFQVLLNVEAVTQQRDKQINKKQSRKCRIYCRPRSSDLYGEPFTPAGLTGHVNSLHVNSPPSQTPSSPTSVLTLTLCHLFQKPILCKCRETSVIRWPHRPPRILHSWPFISPEHTRNPSLCLLVLPDLNYLLTSVNPCLPYTTDPHLPPLLPSPPYFTTQQA